MAQQIQFGVVLKSDFGKIIIGEQVTIPGEYSGFGRSL